MSILGCEGRVQASVSESRLMIEVTPIATMLASSLGSKAKRKSECGPPSVLYGRGKQRRRDKKPGKITDDSESEMSPEEGNCQGPVL